MGVFPEFMEHDTVVVGQLWESFCIPFVVDGMRRKAANQNHQVCVALEGKQEQLVMWKAGLLLT